MFDALIKKANVLTEALPYIQRLSGKTVVVKYGGNAMKDPFLSRTIMQDITLLKYVGVNPILVHGGGPEIDRTLTRLDLKCQFHRGLRITDQATMEVVQMVLAGKINKDIVSQLNCLGGSAIGLCGKDGNLIEVERAPKTDGVDLGFVGKVKRINAHVLDVLAKDAYIPVVAPIGVDPETGESYNVNADTAAGELAAALKAEKLMFLTDIDGVRRHPEKPESIISVLTISEVAQLIDEQVITGGMIPKVESCVRGIQMGVKGTHIVNGTIPHPVLLEIFTDKGIGTMVIQ